MISAARRTTCATRPSSGTGCRPPSSSRISSTRPALRRVAEAVVGQEVAREDRAVVQEALGELGLGGVHDGERLERRARCARGRRRCRPGRGSAATTGSTGRRGRRRSRARRRPTPARPAACARAERPAPARTAARPRAGRRRGRPPPRHRSRPPRPAIQRRLSTARSPCPCHQTQLRQTAGLRGSVAPVRCWIATARSA